MQAAFAPDGSADALFADMPCLHGIRDGGLRGMGRLWGDHPRSPRGAVLAVGDFLLCGGAPGPSAGHLMRRALLSDRRDWLVYAPGPWLEVLRGMARITLERRYAFDHRVQPEDRRLDGLLARMPEGGAIVPIEGEAVRRCREAEWSRDFVSLYTDEDYARKGLGVLLTVDGRAVAGASSYVSYPGGIEVQVQTREGYEGRGYATLAAAGLIRLGYQRGLRVTWDAANPASAHLAEKLGYRPLEPYAIARFEGFDG